MKGLAVTLLILGAAGFGLTLLSSIGGFEFEAYGHTFGLTLTIDWRALVISAPLFVGGIALWFFVTRPRWDERHSPNQSRGIGS